MILSREGRWSRSGCLCVRKVGLPSHLPSLSKSVSSVNAAPPLHAAPQRLAEDETEVPGPADRAGDGSPARPPAADGASASCRALCQAGPGPARRRCPPCSASSPAGQTAEHTHAADSAAGGRAGGRRAVQQRRATPAEARGAASHSGSGSGCARGLGSRSSARAWTATPASGIRSENRGDRAKPRTQGPTLIDQATANPTFKGVEEVIRGSSTEGRGCAC